MARKRYGWLQDSVVAQQVPSVEPRQCCRGSRSNRVENAEKGIAVAALVTPNQRRIVEVVAGVHPHARRQAPTKLHLMLLVKQRHLDAIHLVSVRVNQLEADFGRLVTIDAPPVADKSRVEHVSQPVQDHGLPDL